MKKVLSLVLALAMVLGSFSFVSAASLSDVTDPTLKKAVDRLTLLEVLTGYPDGTFKPEQTITRAEFAAVAVRVKGLADAANAAKGLATGFTDVTPAHWASGFVGTAGKLGIVNGVGNGLFAPEAPVKYEEAITMIVRALGYEPEAQAKGGYPYGYLIVANDRGLLDDVKGTQGAPASRGIVAQITDNALEIPKMIQVGFGTDAKWVVSGSKEHGTDADPQYLLHDLGIDEIKGTVTNTFRTKSTVKADEIEINNTKYDIAEGVDTDAVLGVGVTAWSKNDVVFSVSLGYKLKSAGKDIIFDADQVIYDRVVAADTNDDEVSLYVLDDEYDWASRARIFVNNEDVDADEIPDRAYGRFVLNEDDEVEFAYLFDIKEADTGLVTEIDDSDLNYVNLFADDDNLPLDKADEVYVFNKDLSAASLDDIKENTAVFYWADGDDYYVVISSETLEGTLDTIRVKDSRITVEGTNVKFEENHSILSANDGEDFDQLTDFVDVEDYIDEEVKVYYNLVGDALAVVAGYDATSSTVKGIAMWITSARNPVLTVYTQEGKEVDYTFEDRDDIPTTGAWATQFGLGNIVGVSFKVNKDGEIKEGTFDHEAVSAAYTKDADKKYITDGTDNLYITKDTVIMKALNSAGTKLKPSVIKYDDIIKTDITAPANHAIVIQETVKTIVTDDLELLIFVDAGFIAVDEDEYGIVTTDPVKRGSDYRAKVNVFGKGEEEYVLSNYSTANALQAGDLIKFQLNEKGAVVEDTSARVDLSVDRDTSVETVDRKSGNYIVTTTPNTYRVSDDTIFYSAKKNGSLDGRSSFGRVEAGDTVLLIAEGTELKAVIEMTLYTGAGNVQGPVAFTYNSTPETMTVANAIYKATDNSFTLRISGDALATAVYSDVQVLGATGATLTFDLEDLIPANGVYKVELLSTKDYSVISSKSQMYLPKNN